MLIIISGHFPCWPIVSKNWSRSSGTSPVNSGGTAGSKSGANRDGPTSDLERKMALRLTWSGSTVELSAADGSTPLSSCHGGGKVQG